MVLTYVVLGLFFLLFALLSLAPFILQGDSERMVVRE